MTVLHRALLGALILFGMLLSDAAQAQTVSKEDFRINDENTITTVGDQEAPDVAASLGGYTVVWKDTRGVDSDIYAQLFDSRGGAKGLTLKINNSPAGVFKGLPRVARHFPEGAIGDPFGTSVVVWQDGRQDAQGDIYAQLYNNTSATFIGSNFRVDDAPSGAQQAPAVGMWPTAAGFVVVWADRRNGNDDIYARFFQGNGNPAGASFRVNNDTGQQNQSSPDVAMGPGGEIVVVWRDFRNTQTGISEIYAQRYLSNGSPVGGNFRVDSLVVGAVTPRVEIAGDGSFVIIYTGGSGTNRSILTRRYTSTGTPDGDQVTISASPGLLQWPTVTMLFNQLLKNGYIVTWEKVQPPSIYGDIYMQCVDNQGRLVGNNILVSLPSDSGQGRPGIATLGFGNTNPPNNRSMLVWHDDRIGDLDIWAQLVINECNPNGANFLVNGRSEGRTNQAFSALDATAEGQSIVLWEDDRNVAAGVDIYAKRLDPDDNPLGPDFKINDDAGSQDQREPDVAVHPDGASVAVWADYRRDADGDIFAQRFDANGSPLGSNVVVNDTLSAGGQRTPAVAMKQDGGFAVTWVDTRRMPQGDIFVQSFDADGNPDGGNTRVNTDDSGEQHRDPALAIRRSGEMVITWADAREGDFDVWAQRYDADGNPDGGNTRVNTLSDNVQMLPAVDAAPGGVYLIAWVDYLNTPNGDIMAQRYGDAGPIDGNFQVNDEDNVANPFPFEFPFGPSVAAVPATRSTQRDSTFVVAWTDFRSGTQDPNIYAQCYLASGAPLGTNFRVDDAPVESWQVAPDVARNARDPNGLYFSWTDERTFATEGQSIWGKLFVWDKPVNTSVEQSEGEVPADFVLRQNYPNPFNPQTTIPFAVPVSSRVVLRVFNAMGQQVATLVDGTYAPGHYQATFDAAGLPSGAYFYRIEMGGVHAVRQMVLLK